MSVKRSRAVSSPRCDVSILVQASRHQPVRVSRLARAELFLMRRSPLTIPCVMLTSLSVAAAIFVGTPTKQFPHQVEGELFGPRVTPFLSLAAGQSDRKGALVARPPKLASPWSPARSPKPRPQNNTVTSPYSVVVATEPSEAEAKARPERDSSPLLAGAGIRYDNLPAWSRGPRMNRPRYQGKLDRNVAKTPTAGLERDALRGAKNTGPEAKDKQDTPVASVPSPANQKCLQKHRPPWPTGPFTPEEALYRAQFGWANYAEAMRH